MGDARGSGGLGLCRTQPHVASGLHQLQEVQLQGEARNVTLLGILTSSSRQPECSGQCINAERGGCQSPRKRGHLTKMQLIVSVSFMSL